MSTGDSQEPVLPAKRLRYPLGSTVVPGDRLGALRDVSAGPGTYVQGAHVYACRVGILTMETSTTTDTATIQVVGALPAASTQVLRVGQLVVGRVLRITPQNALVELYLAEHVGKLRFPMQGAIRQEDVKRGGSGSQSLETIGNAFQPNDLVVCRILSMGDSRRYFLSTAEPELGVIRAMHGGHMLIPVSWNEMECLETGQKFPRKCAKPPPTSTSITLAAPKVTTNTEQS